MYRSVPPVFIAALFIIARTWKQPRCPSTDEWMKQLWYIHTMEYYSVIKRNTFESGLMRWINLEPIIQSKVSQKETNITYIWNLERWYRWIHLLGSNGNTETTDLWTRSGTNGGGGTSGESSMDTYILTCKIDASGNLLYDSGGQTSAVRT